MHWKRRVFYKVPMTWMALMDGESTVMNGTDGKRDWDDDWISLVSR